MLDGRIDGVARDERAAYQTLERIRTFSRQEPTVFLPAHDPETTARFLRRQTVPS
jgi:glyoxylase-like metal-dependent hydrolase (beta-lactamase superfamily II)